MAIERREEFLQILKRTYLFSALAEKEVSFILKCVKFISIPKNAELCVENMPGEVCYFIVSGRVKLTSTHSGKEVIIRFLNRGDTIGESILLTGEKYPVTAKADTDVELLSLHKNDFDAFLQKHPRASLQLSRLICRRLTDAYFLRTSRLLTPEIFTVYSCIERDDYISFTLEFALSLYAQTRKKVLLLELYRDTSHVIYHLEGHERKLQQNSMHDIVKKGIQTDAVFKHVSGLETLSVCTTRDDMRIVPSFFYVIRENYQFVVVIMTGEYGETEWEICKESNKILYVFSENFKQAIKSWAVLKDTLQYTDRPPLKVYLNKGLAPAMVNVDFSIPWKDIKRLDSSLLLKKDTSTRTLRAIESFARRLGHVSIGIAMGAGSAFGFAIVGILKVFERHGIYPDFVAGTSMGSVIGAYYLSGRSISEMETEAQRITKRWFWKHMDFAFPRSGLVYGDMIERYLKGYLGEITFSELPIPFACVATDIQTGEEVIINEGPLYKAVRASISIPVMVEPYFYNEHYLVDGGLVDPVPSGVIAQMGADILISINLIRRVAAKKIPFFTRMIKKKSSSKNPKPGILEVFLKTFYTMQYEIARQQTHMSHVVIAPDFKDYSWMEFHHAKEFVSIGERSTEEEISKIKSLLPYFNT